MKDVAQMQPVLANSFRVLADGKALATDPVPVDEKGCLRWIERVDYNRAVRETYVAFARDIEAVGTHRGTFRVRIGLNPWRADPTAVADLSKVSVAPLADDVRALAPVPGEELARIVVKELSVDFSDDRYSGGEASILTSLSTTPAILREGADGAKVSEPWTRGEARISVVLFERVRGRMDGTGDQVTEIARGSFIGKLNRGEFRATDRLRVSKAPARTSLLELAFRLEPADAVPGVVAESGVMRLNSLTTGSRGKTDELKLQVAFDAPALNRFDGTEAVSSANTGNLPVPTRSTVKRPTAATTCSDGSDQFGFYLKDWSAVHAGVTQVSRTTGVPTQLAVAITACIAQVSDQKPVVGHPLDVALSGSKPLTLTTEGDGCVHWTERVSFDYFSSQRWINRDLRVLSRTAPYEGIARAVPLPINPWLQRDQVGWDCRNGSVPRLAMGGDQSARLVLNEFSYEFAGQTPSVDEALTLTLTRKYRFKMTPKIRRWSAVDSAAIYDSVNEGRYQFRVMLLSPTSVTDTKAPFAQRYKFIAAYSAPVQASNGEIIVDVPLPFDHYELPLIGARNAIFLELSPLERNSLAPVLVSGTFTALKVSETHSVIHSVISDMQSPAGFSGPLAEESDTKIAMADLIREAQAAKAQRKATELKAFGVVGLAQSAKATFVTPQLMAKAEFTLEHLHQLAARNDSRYPALLKFCAVAFTGVDLRRCRMQPQRAFKSVRSFLVMAGRPTFIRQENPANVDQITVGAHINHDISLTHTDSKGRSDRAGVSLQGGIGGQVRFGKNSVVPSPVAPSVAVNLNLNGTLARDWIHSVMTAEATSSSSGTSVSQNKPITSEDMEYRLEAPVRTCILVDTVGKTESRFLACTPTATSKSFYENYYYMQQTWATEPTAIRDTAEIMNRPFTFVVRGRTTYLKMRSDLESRLTQITLQKNFAMSDYDQTLTGAARMVNSYPVHSDTAVPGVHE